MGRERSWGGLEMLRMSFMGRGFLMEEGVGGVCWTVR